MHAVVVSAVKDVPLVEFMCLVFTRVRGELPSATQVFVVVLVSRISRQLSVIQVKQYYSLIIHYISVVQ